MCCADSRYPACCDIRGHNVGTASRTNWNQSSHQIETTCRVAWRSSNQSTLFLPNLSWWLPWCLGAHNCQIEIHTRQGLDYNSSTLPPSYTPPPPSPPHNNSLPDSEADTAWMFRWWLHWGANKPFGLIICDDDQQKTGNWP